MPIKIIFFLIVFTPLAYSKTFGEGAYVGIPYEQCNWKNKELTDNMLIKNRAGDYHATEAGSTCLTCIGKVKIDKTAAVFNFAPLQDIDETAALNFARGSLVLNQETYVPDDMQSAYKAVKERASRDIPSNCFYASMLNANYFENTDSNSSYYHCENNKPSSKVSYHGCDMKGEKPESCKLGPGTSNNNREHPEKFCLNKDYVDMTAKAFNEMSSCFGFSHEEKQDLFALFNHESSFMLNRKSSTGARCYGQLTPGVHHDINYYVFSKGVDKIVKEEYNIYNEAWNNFSVQDQFNMENYMKHEEDKKKYLDSSPEHRTRCSAIIGQAVIKKDFEKREINQPKSGEMQISRGNYNKNWSADKSSAFTCGVTNDPYSCFFYSMYYYKINQLEFEESYTKNEHSKINFTEKDYSFFKLPVYSNEILSIKGQFTKGDKTINADWLVADEKELKNLLKGAEYKPGQLVVEKVDVFPKEALKRDVVLRSYNGGSSVARDEYAAFLENLKRQMANPDYCKEKKTNNAKRDCRRLRSRLKKGLSLKPKTLNKKFSAYLKPYTKNTKSQASTFVSGIQNDMCHLRNKGSLDPHAKRPVSRKRNMQTKMKRVHKGVSERAMNRFINHVNRTCPKSRDTLWKCGH